MKLQSLAVLALGAVVFLAGVGGLVYASVYAPGVPPAFLIPIVLVVLPIFAIIVYFVASRDRRPGK